MAPPKPASPRTRLYKEFLTPALHRRFTSAAGLTLLFCWLEASLFSTSTHPLWSWFPFGLVGLRTLLLFIPSLAVFIIRVANLRIGERTSATPVEFIYSLVGSAKSVAATAHTALWYLFSAWIFGEVYIWTRSSTAELGWIDQGRLDERPRLNENPIFLRCLFLVLGVLQTVLHYARDYDQLSIPLQEPGVSAPNDASERPPVKLPQPIQKLLGRSGTLLDRCMKLTICGVLFFGLPAYYTFLRHPAWRITYAIGRSLFSQLPPSAPPTGLLYLPKIAWQAFTTSFLLVALWEISNAAFDIFVEGSPLKKGEPLTSGSVDPNASLLSGLKSKRAIPRSFALWELFLICTQFEGRRKTLYTEVDRKDGSTWSHVCNHCLAEIERVSARIATATAPATPTQPQVGNAATASGSGSAGLPRISSRSIQEDNVFAKPKPDLIRQIGDATKAIGQHPGAQDPVTPSARKALQWSANQLLSKQDQERFTRAQLEKDANGYTIQLLQSPLGEPFRQTFAARVKAVIFGTPTSSRVNIVHAANSLAKLVVLSLQEDRYGLVQKDVARIVRSLTAVIQQIERYTASLPPSWTDVTFTEADRHVPEVAEVLDVLKSGLADILLAFGEYAKDLGLGAAEIKVAKQATTRSASRVLRAG